MTTPTISTAACIAVFMICFSADVAEIVIKPSGTEAVVGRSTYINCSTNSPQEIHWFHIPVGSNQDRSFVYGYNQFYPPYSGRFAVERIEAKGAYNLIITSVKVEDAGQYECQDQNGQGKKAIAQLTVLDADPTCEPRTETLQIIGPNQCGIEPSQLILTCTAKYHGNEAPTMKWSKIGNETKINEGVAQQILNNSLIIYNLTIDGNSEINERDSYFCNTTRSATFNGGCKSGNITVKGAGVSRPTCVASEICQPYIKPYIVAIICIFFLILPAAIVGTFFAVWYPCVYRQKKPNQKEKEPLTCLSDDEKTRIIELEKENKEQANSLNELKHDLTCKSDYGETKIKELEQRNDEQANSLKALKDDLERKCKEAQAFADKVEKQSVEIEELHGKCTVSDNDNSLLRARVKDLERQLYPAGNIDYEEKPTLVYTIITDAETKDRRRAINGMTILGRELFVLHERSSVIEVYDSETFLLERSWVIKNMSDPLDITSCKIVNGIYVILRELNGLESNIMKLEPEGKLIATWPTGGNLGRLSTYESSVIVCLFEKQLINEFNRDGVIIQTVRLSPAVGFNHPWHAIKVTSSHFAVCHGDTEDKLHRVCIVDVQGNIIKQIQSWLKSSDSQRLGKLNLPICLAEDSERSILVVDRGKSKVRLLNCFLRHQRDLIRKENGFVGYPIRICLDETKGRLFVAENALRSNKKEWKDGRILVFRVK